MKLRIFFIRTCSIVQTRSIDGEEQTRRRIAVGLVVGEIELLVVESIEERFLIEHNCHLLEGVADHQSLC